MKKILVMNIGTELGGIEKSLIEFLNFITTEDCEVDLVLWKKRGPLFEAIPDNVNIIENIGPGTLKEIKKSQGFDRLKRIGYYLKFKFYAANGKAWKSVPQLKKRYDVAISYCQNGYSPYYVIDRVNATKKYLWYHHGTYENNISEKKRDAQYYGLYDKLITVSTSNKEMLCKIFPHVTIEVIHNLINESKIRELAKKNVTEFENFLGLKIVSVGRISQEKGHIQSIKVAQKLVEKGIDFKWLFIGDGPLKKTCEELVESYGLQKKCFFLGANRNPYCYISKADLYVQNSFVESEAITVREAIVLNKMVIVTDLPAVRETLVNGKYGCLCKNDIDCFVDRIIYYSNKENQQEILSNIDTRISMNMKIKQQIKALLDI